MGRKTKKNNITSPELLAQVNPENKELLKDFLDYLRSIDRSEGTIAVYESDINIAFVWCLQYNNNLFFCDWTKRQVSKYQNWLLTENGNSAARIRRLKAALSSMSNFIESILDDEYPDFRNIINKIENPPNEPVREKTILEEEDVDSILESLVKKKRFDVACLFALAVYGGRRKSELARFKVSDFDDDKLVCGGALYKSDPIKTKGRGKKGKCINCYTLAKSFKPYFDLWMDKRNSDGVESEWLFPDPDDPSEHISLSTLNSWACVINRVSDKTVYLHALRHLFVTNLVKAGIPDNVVQSIVGWASADMVRIYDDSSTDDQISMYFNEDGIVSKEKKSLSDL